MIPLLEKIIVLIYFGLFNSCAFACTAIAITGSSYISGNQTIITKNRDAYSNSLQNLILYKPLHGYKFIALAYTDLFSTSLETNKSTENKISLYKYLASGTNERGLTIVANNSVNSDNEITVDREQTSLIKRILSNYSTVTEVIDKMPTIFHDAAPSLYMIADSDRIMTIQIAQKGIYRYQIKFAKPIKGQNQGYLYQTNMYNIAHLEVYNLRYNPSAYTRMKTLCKYFKNVVFPVNANNIYTLLSEKNEGSNNSLNRDETAAKYTVLYSSSTKPPNLMVEFTLPTQTYNKIKIKLSEKFFSETKPGIINRTHYGLDIKPSSPSKVAI